jgi:regulatory protein
LIDGRGSRPGRSGSASGDRASGASRRAPAAGGISLRNRALGLLARRDHGRVELARKLQRHAEEGDDIPALLDDLERLGFISDARVAEQLGRRAAGRHGPLRLARDLAMRGVPAAESEEVIATAKADEPAQALAVLRRKFPQPPADAAEYARQGRYLQNRGFSPGVIRRVIRAVADDDG